MRFKTKMKHFNIKILNKTDKISDKQKLVIPTINLKIVLFAIIPVSNIMCFILNLHFYCR